MPLIDLHGNEAILTSYLQILWLDHQGEPRELPNHCVRKGYRIYRVVANRWQLVKTNGEWMIKTSTSFRSMALLSLSSYSRRV